MSVLNKNQKDLVKIRKALQRHPDVFSDLVKQLQNEAANRQDDSQQDEEEEQEVVQEVQVMFLLC